MAPPRQWAVQKSVTTLLDRDILQAALNAGYYRAETKMKRCLQKILTVILLATPIFAPGTSLVAQQPAPKRAEEPKTQTVYITRTGKRYHRDGCRYLASSKIPMTLKDAKAQGYTPCKVCRPAP